MTMNASLIAIIAILFLALAYRYFSVYLSNRIFQSEKDDFILPSEAQYDGVDYVPTEKPILFGHHFSSIAGAAPILGPAIAIIWGWLPALLWIVFGSIFIGAVHDYGSLVLSIFFKGRSIGSITGDIMGERSRYLFLFIIFLLVFIVIAVFAYIIATLFVLYPGSVIPINFEIIVAILIGIRFRKSQKSLFLPSLIALVLLYVTIYIGHLYPIVLPEEYCIGGSQVLTWVIFLMIYGFIAAVLPVTILLQPRDYINSHQLILGLVLVYVGMMFAQPVMDAPAINIVENDISWFPYLFITIACGAISGFHALVSTGTTSKQIKRLKDTRAIGYGSMLGEASLAIAATIAVASGFENADQWHHHYSSFEGAQGLSSKLSAFVMGTSAFIAPITGFLGFNTENQESLNAVFISVLVISFAATSLDTAVRIQRYVLSELGQSLKITTKDNRYLYTALGVIFSTLLVLLDSSGSGGLLLWPLFGSTNQLLGALTLMVISIWLFLKGRNYWITLIPLLILLIIVTIAAFFNMFIYYRESNFLLLSIAIIILICHTWLLIEGLKFVRRGVRNVDL